MTKEELLLDLIRDTIRGTEYENTVFVAGGYVRDLIMGKPSKDIDLAITRPNGGIEFANWITRQFKCHTDGNPVIFPRFGTAKFNLRTTHFRDLSDVDVEAVMPRSEIYSDDRNPEVSFTSLEEDAKRRDFTINSLYLDITRNTIVDFTNGQKDIENKIIRTAIPAEVIFKDDPLRMLRAIRFANRLNFRMDSTLFNGIRKHAELIQTISAERIQDELSKLLLVTKPSNAIRNLRATGLLKFILPEVEEQGGVTQNHYHIDDVFTHTMKVLDGTPPVLMTRLVALFHDVGKKWTRKVHEDGKVKFKGHDETGAVMADHALRRLKFSNEMVDAVSYCVHDHMRLKGEDDTGHDVTDKTLRKLRKDAGHFLQPLLDVMHADNLAHAPKYTTPNRIPNLWKRLVTLAAEAPAKPKLPIDGNDVMQLLGIKPGPIVKVALQAVEDAWMENPTLTRDEALNIVSATHTSS